jgi:uncharacterized membrane protein YecN with MAPEG domain
MVPTITPLYAALAALILFILTFRVILLRTTHKVLLGSGGHAGLEKAMRAHGNFIEYVPLALILILLVEMTGAAPATVHGLGIALIVARLLHAWGISTSDGPNFGRAVGIIVTGLVLLGGAARLLMHYV